MSNDEINQALVSLQEETAKIGKEIEAFTRQKMAPVWNNRREIVRQIPNFWGQAIGNSPLFGMFPSDNDIEAFENLTDFHVEFDDNKPNYRKIVATFKKNDTFKNETLTKEFILNDEGNDAEVISKSTVDYHSGKAPNKKRKSSDDENNGISFLEWFENDEAMPGILLSEDIFPGAIDYYQNDDEDFDDDEDADEIELGSEDEDDEDEDEEEARPSKKSKK